MLKRKIALTTLVLSIPLLTKTVPVYAMEEHAVTFECATSDQTLVFPNESFKIYQIKDDVGNVKEDFASVIESDDAGEYAKDLMAYVKEHEEIQTYAEFTSDEKGEGGVTLSDGSYLLVGETKTVDGEEYIPNPSVLNITEEMYCKLTSYVKYETSTKPEKTEVKTETRSTVKGTVQTGDAGNYWVLLGLSGGAFLMAGMLLREKKTAETKDNI